MSGKLGSRKAVRPSVAPPFVLPETSTIPLAASDQAVRDERHGRSKKKRRLSNRTTSVDAVPPLEAGFVDQEVETWAPVAAEVDPDDASSPCGDESSGGTNNDFLNHTDEDVSSESSLCQSWAEDVKHIHRLSSLSLTSTNILHETEKDWCVSLSRKDSLAVLGQYDLYIRNGTVSISGAVLHASSRLHRVYAPSTHAIPIIRSLRNPYGPELQSVELTIRSCDSGIRMLKDVASKCRRLWNGKLKSKGNLGISKHLFRRSFINLQTRTDDSHQRTVRALEPPEDWLPIITKIMSNVAAARRSTILVCGPKSSGKSTFCKVITNALLTTPGSQSQPTVTKPRVMFLDLDPGQPEFSPPGEISLSDVRSCNLGVPFTHPLLPPAGGSKLYRSHHLGSISPRYDPKHYLDCALDLMHCHNLLLTSDPICPLVINCCGWIQGSGLDLIVQLISHSNATDVIYTSTTGRDEIVDVLAAACGPRGSSLHRVSSQPFQDMTYSASSLRIMQTLSYLHLAESEAGNLRWDPFPLMAMSPMVVPYAGPQQAIFAVMMLGDEQNPEFFPHILDGSVVGIIIIEDEPATFRDWGEFADSMGDRIEAIDNPHFQGLDGVPDDSDALDRPSMETRAASFPPSSPVPQRTTQHTISPKCPEHLKHTLVCRTPTGIPYLPFVNHRTPPLSPRYTRSLGQAMIRSIDKNLHTFHLLTPVPECELRTLHEQKRKIVLVKGKLEIPTWAYKEDLEYERSRRRRQLNVPADLHKDLTMEGEEQEARRWARRQPWVSAVDAKRKGSAKPRRVRRDIRYRGHIGASE
ncbi:MAG: hypothetical protein Q9217_003284 [Psora testacea]